MRYWLTMASTALLVGVGLASAQAASPCAKGEHTPPYTIGWANIYSVPTWMKQTESTITMMADELKKEGLVEKLVITDAQGNASTQIQQIQSMIDAKLDAIVVIAGSATALDRVIADACAKGIVVTNFDSEVDTDQLTSKINTDQAAWGRQMAEFLVKKLNGKGKILVLNGPAGISVSDARRAGAEPVLKANPGIEILTETNTPYNAAPAQEAVTSLLFRYPQIDGILSQGGALSAGAILAFQKQGRAIPVITGENYRQFLELWKENELDSWATMQPNWLGALGVYVAVKALQGEEVPSRVNVPLPIIDNGNIDQYLARAGEFPADGYIYSPFSREIFDGILRAQ